MEEAGNAESTSQGVATFSGISNGARCAESAMPGLLALGAMEHPDGLESVTWGAGWEHVESHKPHQ